MGNQSTEQWLLDGVCKECRRKKYCSKPCTANKRRTQRQLFGVVDAATGGMLSYFENKAEESLRR